MSAMPMGDDVCQERCLMNLLRLTVINANRSVEGMIRHVRRRGEELADAFGQESAGPS